MWRDACRDEASSFRHRCAVQARRSHRAVVAIRKPKYPPGLIPHPLRMSLGPACPDRAWCGLRKPLTGKSDWRNGCASIALSNIATLSYGMQLGLGRSISARRSPAGTEAVPPRSHGVIDPEVYTQHSFA